MPQQSQVFLNVKATMAWYVVHVGQKLGIYLTWEDCYSQVNRYPGALHKKYNIEAQALTVFCGARSANHGQEKKLEIEEKLVTRDMKIRRLCFCSWKDVIILFQAMVIAFLFAS